ncbi:MAG: hypothetical protein JW821_17940 [Deltaproteobacteria bacterium]|nr:hypothetical protein [Deltaproteobacteria bacterium]
MVWDIAIRLVAGSFVITLFLAAFFVAFLRLFLFRLEPERAKWIPAVNLGLLGMNLVKLYVLGMWAAFCVHSVLGATNSTGSRYGWVFVAIGCLFCLGPLVTMVVKFAPLAGKHRQLRGLWKGLVSHSAFALLLYVLFSIWPSLVLWPYGWFVKRIF